ncbi:MAG TPA: zinc ribbon domain-containing protein [Pyrinomonadaceae bacterium]|jgi:hypothetical protein|nr:zinc ribbon domain-containing protein [Pyrinomonadaceae bacterium]
MICPRCASNQTDNVKFCTFCGANLEAVREVLAPRDPDKKFNWNDTWVAEMFRSGEIAEQRKREIERRQGITPEVKRYNEIKAGVIVSSAGIGLSIFLFIFMQGIAHNVLPNEAEIVTRLWIAGVLPFFVGLALILNGLFVSRRQAEIIERERKRVNELEDATPELNATPQRTLRPAETNEFIPTPFSVTDQTTRHLVNAEPDPKRER